MWNKKNWNKKYPFLLTSKTLKNKDAPPCAPCNMDGVIYEQWGVDLLKSFPMICAANGQIRVSPYQWVSEHLVKGMSEPSGPAECGSQHLKWVSVTGLSTLASQQSMNNSLDVAETLPMTLPILKKPGREIGHKGKVPCQYILIKHGGNIVQKQH